MKVSYRLKATDDLELTRSNASLRPAPQSLLLRTPLRNLILHAAAHSATADCPVATNPEESQTGSLSAGTSLISIRPQAVGTSPLGPFKRVAGAPAPAAVTAAAVAATVAAAEGSSKNTFVSLKYRPFLDSWDKGFEFNAVEEPHGTWLQVTEGEIPSELVGTFFRNGPGRFSRGTDSTAHPYDGDGLVASVAFPGDGRAFFRSAFVRTLEYEAEELAGRLLFRGAMASRGRSGLLANAGNLALRNAANAGVVLQGGRLLALYPGGLPYALDPATLATHGLDHLGGILSPGVPLSVGSPAADQVLSRLNYLLGFNDRLPPAHSAVGGDGCGARPRTCSATGRRVFWSHRTLLAGMPLTGATGESETTASGEAVLAGIGGVSSARGVAGEARRSRLRGDLDKEGPRMGLAKQEELDALEWLGATLRWLRRAPQDRFETDITFWEVDPNEDEDQNRDQVLDTPREQQRQRWQNRSEGRRCLTYRMSGFVAAMVHDVAVTPNYYVLIQPPVHLEILPYLLGECGPISSMKWREGETAVVHVVPRPGSEAERRGERPVQLPLSPAVCVLHHVNSYEDESHPGRLVLDSVAYDSLPAVGAQPLPEQAALSTDPDAGCRPRLQRLVVDLPAATITLRPVPGCPPVPLDRAIPAGPARHVELPTFNTAYTGRRYRYVYGCSVVFEDTTCGVVKVDMELQQLQRWTAAPGYICLEPCFVPRLPLAALETGASAAAVAWPAGSRALPYNVRQHIKAIPPPASMTRRQRSEDDGWLLVYGFDSHARRSELLVFDAWAIMAGPVARLALPSPLPHGLYGTWTDEYFGPQ